MREIRTKHAKEVNLLIAASLTALLLYSFFSVTPVAKTVEEYTPLSEDIQDQGHRLGFSIGFDNVKSNLAIQSVSVMPGGKLIFDTPASLLVEDGIASRSEQGWTWEAPEQPGHFELDFRYQGELMRVNVFVLTPFKNGKDESLRGYRVGKYSDQPLKGLPKYIPPPGFIDMQPGMENIQVAPHFKLGQFICKQQPGHESVFLLIQPDLLLKLEKLLEAANDKGWKADSFVVMSAFRTPFYNESIGNKTTSSRHLFGDAADIYIDHDGDGVMDDLNGDGKITKEDAIALADLAQSIAEADPVDWPAGGIGIYGANAVRGPFVHVDARGYPARWG